jgi:hypothetical protein
MIHFESSTIEKHHGEDHNKRRLMSLRGLQRTPKHWNAHTQRGVGRVDHAAAAR